MYFVSIFLMKIQCSFGVIHFNFFHFTPHLTRTSCFLHFHMEQTYLHYCFPYLSFSYSFYLSSLSFLFCLFSFSFLLLLLLLLINDQDAYMLVMAMVMVMAHNHAYDNHLVVLRLFIFLVQDDVALVVL